MCSNDIQPLRSLKELWEWDRSKVDDNVVGKALDNYTSCRKHAETLVCHDMKGGYLPEESMNGCQLTISSTPYVVLHWWYMDVFVYFSHHFITIPPFGWINQAHAHGVIVLGTFITEWETGAEICAEMLSSVENVERTVSKLTEIAVRCNFEGWLVNIENEIKVSQIDLLAKFLSLLTERMRSAVGKLSRVIWYDAVTAEGKLKWQNELNDRNERWFSCTDGIFLNYGWDPKQLFQSTERAAERRHRVYVGVDCFGRGCYGGGGWNCYEAFSQIRRNDLSVALFAPGWVAETLAYSDIIVNSLRFWDRLNTFVYAHPITSLPIETNFSIGFHESEGNYKCYSLSSAALQPHYLSNGAFPRTTGSSLVLPGRATYKLFETDLVLKGHFTITVDADASLQLVVWKEGTERDLPTEIRKKENEAVDVWDVEFQNERIRAIGLACDQVVIVRSFSMKQTSPISTRK
uniref:Cytosolic endo-beta-N-acetylglucosaminidase n=1 Tax=Ascaris suum TaxID=6253 RepID=F1L2F3_ASCSU